MQKEVKSYLMTMAPEVQLKYENLINFKNGLYDLNNNTLMPHSPYYFTINQINANINWDPVRIGAVDSFLDKIEAKYVKKEILPDGKLWLKYKDIDLQLVLEFDKTYQYRENDIKALNDALKAIFSENNIAEIKRLSFIKRTEISLWKED